MKNKKALIFIISLTILLAVSVLFTALTQKEDRADNVFLENPEQLESLELVYFYRQIRCPACIFLEEHSQSVVDEYFSEELNNGSLTFRAVNIDQVNDESLISEYEASGSSLKFNKIYADKNHIEEDFTVWRLTNNEESFKSYLKEKIELILE